jgi:phage-related protein
MASKSFGGTVKLTGESEYQKALRGITDNLKVLNSEMKVVTSQYDKNDNSSQKLKATSEVLNKKIAEQESKIKVLKSALAQAEQETGKNSDTTKKWQMQLNNAEAELNDLNKELRDQHGNLDKAGEKALKLGDIIKGNLISEGIIAGVKGLGKAIGAVGSAFINVGKQAVQSYAQYEQLVGGVDTLFKDSSAKVQEYASNAFKTSGMSANQYMETVTSFSASLIASLDGDTEKASEVANRAIIDMSDNANKMGTDISMIQNAYQGFAKQNYTMLDNLKLGYGGTKEEMARLISEASQMTEVQKELGITVADGDMSFANIANAISVVQKNMGLMGATADEAKGTISGSTGSMQSAWQNLVTGIADDNADFETLVNNLVTSIVGDGSEENGGFIGNMLPRVQTALDGIVTMVVSLTDTLLPQIVVIGTDLITNLAGSISENMPALLASASTILDTLITGILTLLPTLLPVAISMIETLINSILSNLPMILETGILLCVTLAQGIASMLPDLIPLAINAVLNLVETLIDNIDLVIDAGIEMILGLADGLIYALPDLIDKAPVIITKLINAIVSNFPKIVTMAGELIGKMAVGLIASIPRLLTAIPEIIAQLIGGFFRLDWEVKNIGLNLVKGIWEGISGSLQWLKDKLTGWVGNVTDFLKRMFGINSPSKLFKEQIGTNLALGVGEGFTDTMADVSADMQGAIPTEFDTSVNMSGSSSSYGSNYDYLVTAFKEALKDVKVVMSGREMGAFIIDTVEREVYA